MPRDPDVLISVERWRVRRSPQAGLRETAHPKGFDHCIFELIESRHNHSFVLAPPPATPRLSLVAQAEWLELEDAVSASPLVIASCPDRSRPASWLGGSRLLVVDSGATVRTIEQGYDDRTDPLPTSPELKGETMPPAGNSGDDRSFPKLKYRETDRVLTRHTSSKFDWTLVACSEGRVAGTVDLMTDVDDDEPELFVRMVRSAQAGTASAMLDELERRYPEHFIRGGPIRDHEPGGRQFLRRRLAEGLPTIHAPECSRDRCVCVEELSMLEDDDSQVERRSFRFDPTADHRLCDG